MMLSVYAICSLVFFVTLSVMLYVSGIKEVQVLTIVGLFAAALSQFLAQDAKTYTASAVCAYFGITAALLAIIWFAATV